MKVIRGGEGKEREWGEGREGRRKGAQRKMRRRGGSIGGNYKRGRK